MEKRQALKRLLEAGRVSDAISPPVARSAPQSPERTEQAQEQIQKKFDGSKMKGVTGGREWGAAGLVPEDGWHGARVDSRSPVTAAPASRAPAKNVSSAMSTGSASSRSKYLAVSYLVLSWTHACPHACPLHRRLTPAHTSAPPLVFWQAASPSDTCSA